MGKIRASGLERYQSASGSGAHDFFWYGWVYVRSSVAITGCANAKLGGDWATTFRTFPLPVESWTRAAIYRRFNLRMISYSRGCKFVPFSWEPLVQQDVPWADGLWAKLHVISLITHTGDCLNPERPEVVAVNKIGRVLGFDATRGFSMKKVRSARVSLISRPNSFTRFEVSGQPAFNVALEHTSSIEGAWTLPKLHTLQIEVHGEEYLKEWAQQNII